MSVAPPAPQKAQFVVNGPLHGPWPNVTLWARRMPGPARPASSSTVIAVAAATMVAAVSLPLGMPGIGWLITAVAGATCLLLARPSVSTVPALVARPDARPRWDQPLWGVATIALLGVG